MSGRPNWWLLLPPWLRQLPADLAAVLICVLLTILSVGLPGVNQTPLRVVFGLVFVLFVPGYAFIAALFPEAGDSPTAEEHSPAGTPSDTANARAGIDGIERVALSFGTSIAIVPLVGLVLNFTPWGIRLAPILVSISALTVGLTAIAAHRRRELPEENRFRVPYDRWLAQARTELFEPDTRTDAALNVLLAISVVLAVGSVGYAVAVPQQGESFSEFYLLTETENGELVADDYPTDFTAGEGQSLVVGIGNHEHESVTYTVVVELHRVQIQNNSTTVLEETELRRVRTQLDHNETWHHNHTIQPDMTGTDLRLTYLLYTDSPPADPTVDNAYRQLHLWINVTAPDTTQRRTAVPAATVSR